LLVLQLEDAPGKRVGNAVVKHVHAKLKYLVRAGHQARRRAGNHARRSVPPPTPAHACHSALAR
jgi:hypothetical protein